MALSITLVGCGAIAETAYVPALEELVKQGEVTVTAVVDRDPKRAELIRARFGEMTVALSDWSEVKRHAQAAILALPHALHEPVACGLASSGIHIFVEKPMALTAQGCRRMIQAARDGHAKLGVAMVRRFYASTRFVKKIIDGGLIGKPTRFEFVEGSDYCWPTVSGFVFDRDQAGGGCLIDQGIHVLDLIQWLLGDCEIVSYRDDNLGGMEANCHLKLKLRSGAEGTIQLSRTHALGKRVRIEGTHGWIEFSPAEPRRVRWCGEKSGEADVNLSREGDGPGTFEEAVREQILDWLDAIRENRDPFVTGGQAVKSVEIVESCYRRAERLEMPWLALGEIRGKAERIGFPFRDKKVLITGASGFIGGRLSEVLSLGHASSVRGMVHDWKRAAVLSRLPVEMVQGDVLDPQSVGRAVNGCEYVFHLAFGKVGNEDAQLRTTVEGTRTLAEACLQAHVRRLIFVSSTVVHGWTLNEKIDAFTHRRRQGDPYADGKIEAEKLLERFHHECGLDYVVLRPCIVYGPRAVSWILKPWEQIKRGCWVIAGNGHGACNVVYVDSLIDCLLAAALVELKDERLFPVTDKTLSWWEYGESLRGIAGGEKTSLRYCTADKWRGYRERKARFRLLNRDRSWTGKMARALRFTSTRARLKEQLGWLGDFYDRTTPGLATRLFGEIDPEEFAGPNGLPEFNRFAAAATESTGSVDGKATRKSLGLGDPISFEKGMEFTRAWLAFMEGRWS